MRLDFLTFSLRLYLENYLYSSSGTTDILLLTNSLYSAFSCVCVCTKVLPNVFLCSQIPRDLNQKEEFQILKLFNLTPYLKFLTLDELKDYRLAALYF